MPAAWGKCYPGEEAAWGPVLLALGDSQDLLSPCCLPIDRVADKKKDPLELPRNPRK